MTQKLKVCSFRLMVWESDRLSFTFLALICLKAAQQDKVEHDWRRNTFCFICLQFVHRADIKALLFWIKWKLTISHHLSQYFPYRRTLIKNVLQQPPNLNWTKEKPEKYRTKWRKLDSEQKKNMLMNENIKTQKIIQHLKFLCKFYFKCIIFCSVLYFFFK